MQMPPRNTISPIQATGVPPPMGASSPPGRPPMQAAPLARLPISNEEMLKRVGRISGERNSSEVVGVMLSWMGSLPNIDPMALWRLMESVEQLDRVNPFAPGGDSAAVAAALDSSMSGGQQTRSGGGGGAAFSFRGLPMLESQSSFTPAPSPGASIEVAELRAAQLAMERRFEEQFQALARAQSNLTVASSAAAAANVAAMRSVPIAAPLGTPGGASADHSMGIPAASSGSGGGGLSNNVPNTAGGFYSPVTPSRDVSMPGQGYDYGAPSPPFAATAASPATAGSITGDLEFQRRMERVRARKMMVDKMLGDIGGASSTAASPAA